jgi:uncharacterized protein
MQKPFLTAEWRNLIMVNYLVPGDLLTPYLPAGVELDAFESNYYVSLVAFHFLNTKVRGIAFPFHKNFEEVNLRFYVKYREGNEYKRGVVFISEIVPKRMIAWIAKIIYGEKYSYSYMSSSVEETEGQRNLLFNWGYPVNHWLQVITENKIQAIETGSKEEFIFEHYWGYTTVHNNKTGEYSVEHPRWNVYPVADVNLQVDFKKLYGSAFAFLNTARPDSVFVAEGSAVKVHHRKIVEE